MKVYGEMENLIVDIVDELPNKAKLGQVVYYKKNLYICNSISPLNWDCVSNDNIPITSFKGINNTNNVPGQYLKIDKDNSLSSTTGRLYTPTIINKDYYTNDDFQYDMFLIDASANDVTINLPNPADYSFSIKSFIVINDTHNVKITTANSDYDINKIKDIIMLPTSGSEKSRLTLYCNTSNWYILDSYNTKNTQFNNVSYHDFVTPFLNNNITTGFNNNYVNFIDFTTGVPLSIQMSTDYATAGTSIGGVYDYGTKAYEIFLNNVDPSGVPYGTKRWHYINYHFNNLNPNKRYRVTLFGNRNITGINAMAKCTINGTTSHENTSIGTNIYYIDNKVTEFNFSYNNNGSVIQFDEITANYYFNINVALKSNSTTYLPSILQICEYA